MEDKKWYLSRGIWGSLMSVAAGISGSLGYVFTAEEVTLASELIVGLIATGAGILSFIGRVKAKTKIKK